MDDRKKHTHTNTSNKIEKRNHTKINRKILLLYKRNEFYCNTKYKFAINV